jgi:hypothetical protein
MQLLEALTKNCGKIFHIQIAHRDFLKELKGVIGPKNNPPLAIQQRVLGMIQVSVLIDEQATRIACMPCRRGHWPFVTIPT